MRALAAELLALAACGSSTPPPHDPGSGTVTRSEVGMTTIVDLASAKAALGKRVTVTGTAGNAKLGSAVTIADLVVYCLGIPAWPDAVSGKPVTVRGTLEQTDRFEATTGPNGEVSAGTGGAVFVLRECAYDRP